MSPRRGPDLPYSVVAAVTPSASRWLVASAKVQGSTFAPEPPKVYDTFNEIFTADKVAPTIGERLCAPPDAPLNTRTTPMTTAVHA